MSESLKPLRFKHVVIDDRPLGANNDICLVGDINGDGKSDIVIASKYGRDNVVWYENPTWRRHVIGTAHCEAGGLLADLTGSGRLDFVAGAPGDNRPGFNPRDLFWFQCPADPRQRWKGRRITSNFRKYHDQAWGDVDGDGKPELVFASQGSRLVGYFDIPSDPTVEPWPDDHCHVIATDIVAEGLVVADLDGDGQNEILAGPNILKRRPDGQWSRTPLPVQVDPRTCSAVGDLDGDGRLDIVLTEGELDRAKVVWLQAPDWRAHVLAEDFFHPHSLAVADFAGTGRLDIFVGEMGLNGHATPREAIFRNLGGGQFQMEVVAHLATHAAKVADIDGDGRPDIVGKPYESGVDQVDLWMNLG